MIYPQPACLLMPSEEVFSHKPPKVLIALGTLEVCFRSFVGV